MYKEDKQKEPERETEKITIKEGKTEMPQFNSLSLLGLQASMAH